MSLSFRLLIVEDSEDDALLLLRGLQREGLDPEWERVDAPEAMAESLGRRQWDLVISDHGMPRFSAPAALRMVRERNLDLPFIIVSGTMGEEAAVEAMRVGAQDYILKGRPAKLAAAVRRELGELDVRRAHLQSLKTLELTRAKLDAATRQLIQAEKLSALGELVAGVAHELNNPLTAVLGYAQLALAMDDITHVRRRLETVISEAERAGKIVRNLLTFARRQPPEKKHLDLNAIIEKTLELRAYHFKTSQIVLEKDLAPALPRTMLDFQQIQQVLLNLFNNAEQAMLEARKGGRLLVSTAREEGWLEVRVRDDGPGIPREQQQKIFEPFFTTKSEGKGTGLGLSLCYGIVEEHGGRIWVESQPGHGATFIVWLPILDASAAIRPPAPPESPSREPRALRVCIVDDEPSIQAMLADLLAREGCTVETTSDFPQAVEMIGRTDFDLVITDMKMPGGTGRDLYEELAGSRPALARRIIFMTGDGAGSETHRLLEETGNQVVIKPFSLDAMRRAIAAAIED
ncbi:MAG TPA: response regulator [Candidatus Polarisedimenticolia bacterium]|nr:response regulator [Candidatus Polarisedimenticolia bacterium]